MQLRALNWAAVMKACLSVWGVTDLPILARRAVLRTIRPAARRSSRRPSAARNTGPPVRSPMARSIARAVRCASGMVTARRPCPAAPGPLEGYAARFDDLFSSLAQRRGFREYLAGLLAPRDRNKTLTALAGAEPVTGAQHPAVQRLQFFLSESRWDPEQVNARRLELLLADPATAPHGGGVLVIDDSGDRKDGTKTAHVGRQ